MTDDAVDHMVRNRHLVESLERSLRSGKHGLSVVPGLLKRLLQEESWREFTTQRDELVHYERFADFVVTPPLKGLGTTNRLLEKVIESIEDPAERDTLRDLLDRALQNPVGGSSKVILNDDVSNNENDQRRPTGTSKSYALRKLRKDAPELHAEVLAGNLTAHAAMVQAGYRPHTFTVRADSAESVAAALRRQLPPDVLADVQRLIAS